jgi:histidinol dehydrogenase
MVSPGGRDGHIPAVKLAAAAIAGVDRVFMASGAQAIAALAYGTESFPRVDKIVGPGSIFVTLAKRMVYGDVGIDSIYGPTETVIVADDSADPAICAADLIAQAEHDPDACAVAVAIGAATARGIEAALARALEAQPRREIIAASLAARGGVLSAGSLDEAIEFANHYAAEHLLLVVADFASAFARLRNTGAVFLGASSSVAFGDYMTGANHTLPTGGAARSYSGLSTLDFVRWTSYQLVSPEAAARLAGDVAAFATAEGLPGHAAAASAWRES